MLGRLRAAWARLQRRLTLDGRLWIARPWLFLPLLLLMLVAALLPARWIWFVAYAYALLIAAAYLWLRTLGPRVLLRRHWSGAWLQAGDVLEERWELLNTSWLPLLWLEVDDSATLPGYSGHYVVAAGGHERQQWRSSFVCRQRGIYRLGPFVAQLGDPFGIFAYAWADEQSHQLVVYPPLLALPPLLIPHGQRGGLARAALRQQQTTPSVSGLRAYTPGDPPSRIHWPTVAKIGELMVKEFDQERAGALWIVLDLQAAVHSALPARQPEARPPLDAYQSSSRLAAPELELDLGSTLELTIALGCSLVAQVLNEGRSVGMLADDGRQRLVMPGQGPRQLWRILGALIDAQASGPQPLGTVLQQGQAAVGAQLSAAALVVITPALDGAWLPAVSRWQGGRNAGMLALLVAQTAEQAQPLTASLAALGMPAQTFELGVRLPPINPARPRSVQRVSPLGKVVRADLG